MSAGVQGARVSMDRASVMAVHQALALTHPPLLLYASAFRASFSRRTKTSSGASIPNLICAPRTSATMTVILSPMRFFSSSFKVKIKMVGSPVKRGPSALDLSFSSWLV